MSGRWRSDPRPLHLPSARTFPSVLRHVRLRFENVPLPLWSCGRCECVACFVFFVFFSSGLFRISKPNRNRRWYSIYCKSQACVSALMYTHTQTVEKKKRIPKDCEIKTPNSRFHLTLFRIFPSRCLPLGPSCCASCFAIGSAFSSVWDIVSRTIAAQVSYRRPGELSPQLCILPNVGFHSSGEPLSRWDVSLQRASSPSLCPALQAMLQSLKEMEIKHADVRYRTCDGGQEHDWRLCSVFFFWDTTVAFILHVEVG